MGTMSDMVKISTWFGVTIFLCRTEECATEHVTPHMLQESDGSVFYFVTDTEPVTYLVDGVIHKLHVVCFYTSVKHYVYWRVCRCPEGCLGHFNFSFQNRGPLNHPLLSTIPQVDF